jgi:hypothetical protein
VRGPEPVVLQGHGVVLEPLAPRHVPDLWEARRDAVVWRWLSVPPPASVDDLAALVDAALADAHRLSWAVIVDGRAAGSTSYLDVDLVVGGLEVGWTWYSPPLWRTHVNPACKLLLLEQACRWERARLGLLLDPVVGVAGRARQARGQARDGSARRVVEVGAGEPGLSRACAGPAAWVRVRRASPTAGADVQLRETAR